MLKKRMTTHLWENELSMMAPLAGVALHGIHAIRRDGRIVCDRRIGERWFGHKSTIVCTLSQAVFGRGPSALRKIN